MKKTLSPPNGVETNPTPIWVSAVALLDGTDRVLMQQRPSGVMHADLWEFPGGKLEPRESPINAAVRELREELAVEVAPGDLMPAAFASREHDAHSPAIVILLFACRRWQGEPMALAASRLQWEAADRLGALAMPPLDYPLAAALLTMLRSNAF